MRTTVNIDDPILKELKRLQKREGKPLGRLISDLLAFAMRHRRGRGTGSPEFRWEPHPMGARVNLDDRDAIFKAMEGKTFPPGGRERHRT
jgi:hypothetical protein